MNALEHLEAARQARSRGDIAACLEAASAAVHCAGTEHDHETAFAAYTCVGNAYVGRGEAQHGLAWHRWALEKAIGGGLTLRLGQCYHNLSVAGRDAGNWLRAGRHAETAMELYRAYGAHAQVAAVVADIAESRLMREGKPEAAADAMDLWRSASLSVVSARDRMVVGANWLYAASVLKIEDRYRRAAIFLGSALSDRGDDEYAAVCLITAAKAALGMEEFGRANNLAAMAVFAATERGETVLLAQAEVLRDAALAERKALAYT